MIPIGVYGALQSLLICLALFFLFKAINQFLRLGSFFSMWKEVRSLRISVDRLTAIVEKALEEIKKK